LFPAITPKSVLQLLIDIKMPPKRKLDTEEAVEARPTRAAKIARTTDDEKVTKGTKTKVSKTRSKKEARYSSRFFVFSF
jgi:hypothetical protein